MASITTFEQAMAAIWERSGYDRGFISDPFAGDEAARRGLLRTQAMLDHLGNPQRSYPVVHVAGSKGKGSTCVFVDAILRASGRTSGRYLSPHLHSYLERFVVDDTPISEADFTVLTSDALGVAEQVEELMPELGQITAFELTTAMALLWFECAGCDAAVIEVGLGGTLDATNVIDPAVSVITQLDYEHTAILGTTMSSIASNKAGIIKQGRPVVSASQPAEGLAVIKEHAAANNSPLLVASRDWTVTGTDRSFVATGPWGSLADLHLSLLGQHQVENAALAIAAVHMLDPDIVHAPAIRQGLEDAHLPGRFEQVTLDSGQVVIIDGAHTPSAAGALAKAVHDHFPGIPLGIVIGMLSDKEPTAVISPMLDIADHWITVTPDSPRALPATEIAAALASLCVHSDSATSVAQGIRDARTLGYAAILITGSLVTAAEARVAVGLTDRRTP